MQDQEQLVIAEDQQIAFGESQIDRWKEYCSVLGASSHVNIYIYMF